MAKKVCKTCRMFVEGNECPVCKSSNFTDSWKGRINITDAENSALAKKIGIKMKGEYAIKIR